MNWMLEKCGSLAVLVSLRTIFPLSTSATNRSTENTLRVERNATHRPSDLTGRRRHRERRLVRFANRGVPVVRQFLGLDAEDAFDRAIRIPGRGAQREHAPDHVVAVGAGDVGPERLAPAV